MKLDAAPAADRQADDNSETSTQMKVSNSTDNQDSLIASKNDKDPTTKPTEAPSTDCRADGNSETSSQIQVSNSTEQEPTERKITARASKYRIQTHVNKVSRKHDF